MKPLDRREKATNHYCGVRGARRDVSRGYKGATGLEDLFRSFYDMSSVWKQLGEWVEGEEVGARAYLDPAFNSATLGPRTSLTWLLWRIGDRTTVFPRMQVLRSKSAPQDLDLDPTTASGKEPLAIDERVSGWKQLSVW